MPFASEIYNPDGSTTVLWSVNESVDELVRLCHRRDIDTAAMQVVRAANRRVEQLAEHLLLHTIYGHDVVLEHTADGAPYVPHSTHRLSISHTTGLVVVTYHPDHAVGVDVEIIGPRVLRVRERFLTSDECCRIAADDELDNVLAWTAKEALYKVSGDKDATMSEFVIDPFRTTRCGMMRLTAHRGDKHYDLAACLKQDYVISVAWEKKEVLVGSIN